MNTLPKNDPSTAAAHPHRSRVSIARNCLLLIVSLLLLALSIRLTAANVLVDRALSTAEHLATQEPKTTPSFDVVSTLNQATDLNSLDADAWLFRAKLSSKASRNPSEYYIRALRLRPHSGSLWAEYAEYSLQERLGSVETLARLDRALALAPFKPSVRRIEVNIGLTLWPEVDQARQAQFLASVNHLLPHDQRFVISTAVTHNWTDNLRPLLTGNDELKRLDRALADHAKHKSSDP